MVGVSKTNHKERNQNILDLTNKARASLGTQNARIGKVVIETYQDAEEMSAWLPSLAERAVMSLRDASPSGTMSRGEL